MSQQDQRKYPAYSDLLKSERGLKREISSMLGFLPPEIADQLKISPPSSLVK